MFSLVWNHVASMTVATFEPLSVGDGLELTLSSSPPEPSLFKIITVVEGRGRWVRGHDSRPLESSSTWWAGSSPEQRWESQSGEPVQWLCLSGDRCPVPALEDAFRVATEGNVGEAAYRVGYTNTSHFAQAFQKEFGVNPGTLARSHS